MQINKDEEQSSSTNKQFEKADLLRAEKFEITNDRNVKKSKLKTWPIIAVVIVVLTFVFTTSVWVYAQYMQSIGQCGSGSGICYTVVEDGTNQKRVSLSNLDPSKKYRIYIKRTVGSQEVDVGEVVLDMKQKPVSVPVPITCTETDGGYNIDVKGTLKAGNFEIEETCSDAKTVVELYCTSNGYKRELYDCSPGTCSNGMCIQSSSPASCTDSDGGVRFFSKGHLSWPVQSYETDDFCKDANTVTEYYCDGNMYKSYDYPCPSGCSNGACNKVPYGMMCMDEDACTVGECKFTGKYGLNTGWANERYCCNANECASMHPNADGTVVDFSIPGANCVGTGGVDENVDVSPIGLWTCNNGKWTGINDSCVEHNNHIEDSYGLNCCASLVEKIATYDPGGSWQNALCCNPDECADMAVCVSSDTIAGTNTCVNGSWQ